MDIKELKEKLEKNDLEGLNSFVFVKTDDTSDLIIDQYVTRISKILGLNKKIIEDLNEIPDDSFIIDDNLYILITDKWKLQNKDNCIIICKSTNDKEAIKIPSLEDWQVVDYAIPKVKGMNKQDIENLIKKYSKNYLRFINDIDKISIFNEGSQNLVYHKIVEDGMFDQISNLTIWDLSNAIIKKDTKTIVEVLKVIDYIDVEPLGLAKVLYNNFRTITSIQTNARVTAKDVGMSDKQFYVIKKYNCGFYSNDQLVKIMDLLTNIEYLFKYSELPMSSLIDYMICKILGV